LEEEIALFDEQQKYAALSQLNGPQRIRGLAGSGKTIILCIKAAFLHLKYPEKKILYTFMTRSLYDYIQVLITRFYKLLGDGNLPDFDNSIHIRHAWGGRNLPGVYYDTCLANGIEPLSYNAARFNSDGGDLFDYVCEQLLNELSGDLIKEYDYVLIDEGQDFKPRFYQLCRAIVTDDCLVWAYDELQNVFNVNLQNTINTFENKFGAQGIDLAELQKNHPEIENDIVLSKCYRNPREILVTAHAIGFGIYNDLLIQSLENNDHWEDLGYEVISGNCQENDNMVISRPQKNSPLTISIYQDHAEILTLFSALSLSEETTWVCENIIEAINNQHLRPDDIIVISLDDRNARTYFSEIEKMLFTNDIYTNNLLTNSYNKGFFKDNCVTLSTVYRAKGNEAAMVFVIGCDVFENNLNKINMRNRVFTAFTRAKAWLRVSGIGIEDHSLVKEVQKVKENDFILKFKYKPAHIIQRDLAEGSKRSTETREKAIEEIRSKLLSSGFSISDIDSAISALLQKGRDKK